MRHLLASLGLLVAAYSIASAQFLADFDAVMLRSDEDEVVVASEQKISDLQHALGFDATVSEWRFYRKKGQADFRVNVYVTTGAEAGRLSGMFAQIAYPEAVRDLPRADRESVLRLSDGTVAVVYPAGLSANDGYSLECIMPLLKDGAFVRIAANSIGFSESDDTRDFAQRFRNLALRYCEAVRKGEASKAVEPTR